MAWLRKNQTEPEEEEIEEEDLKQRVKEIPSVKKYKQSISTPKERYEVVRELPVQSIRKYKDENGNIINLITIEEALTEFMNQ